MSQFTNRLSQHLPWVYALCLLGLAALLLLSPAEATLGSIVKLVYLHGAFQRVSVWAFGAAALAGLVQLAARHPRLAAWTQALTETALVFWVAHFVISIPAQVMSWGGIAWNEPRVVSAVWIAVIAGVIYVIALWIARPAWWALSGLANLGVVLFVLQGAVNILHPLSPILNSDSVLIKAFYAAIVLVSLALACALTVDLKRRAPQELA